MNQKVFVYDPTMKDKESAVRGIGRYLQILKENFPDWVYTSDLSSIIYNLESIFINPFFNFLQPPLTLKRIAKKQIAVIHDLIPLKYPSHFPPGIKGSIYIVLNKLALKNYDMIITDSEASKIDIIKILKLPERKIKVIYPCLPKNFTESQTLSSPPPIGVEGRLRRGSILSLDSRLRGNDNFCLYVGDATWNKNLVNIARAIKIANITCIFVGKVFNVKPARLDNPVDDRTSKVNKWQKELKEFYELTKDDKRFIFAGFISDLELFKLYEQALANLLLSSSEGFGFSYLESANFSCPSLLSDIPVLKEISGSYALFANPLNPQDIAEKIMKINSDKILRNKIGSAAKKRSEYFSPEKFKKEFLYETTSLHSPSLF